MSSHSIVTALAAEGRCKRLRVQKRHSIMLVCNVFIVGPRSQ